MNETERLVAELLTIAVAVSTRRHAFWRTWKTDARRMAAIITRLSTSWADAQEARS